MTTYVAKEAVTVQVADPSGGTKQVAVGPEPISVEDALVAAVLDRLAVLGIVEHAGQVKRGKNAKHG